MKFNLSDRVRFWVQPGWESLFKDDLEVTFTGKLLDGKIEAEAQFDILMAIIGPELRPWRSPPIGLDVEILR